VIERQDQLFRVSGPVTMDNVRVVIEEGRRAFDHENLVVDLSGLETVDSSAISMMLEWMRDATRLGRRIGFRNVPENLKTLARVYGVFDELPLAG
jgi:phospholipid transport system transporter-binding protein